MKKAQVACLSDDKWNESRDPWIASANLATLGGKFDRKAMKMTGPGVNNRGLLLFFLRSLEAFWTYKRRSIGGEIVHRIFPLKLNFQTRLLDPAVIMKWYYPLLRTAKLSQPSHLDGTLNPAVRASCLLVDVYFAFSPLASFTVHCVNLQIRKSIIHN